MLRRLRHHAWTLIALHLVAGCGGKATLDDSAGEPSDYDPPLPRDERCNGLDDDLDGSIDEDFRDDEGRYVHPLHCGACGRPCVPRGGAEAETRCEVIDGRATCAATACAPGFGVTTRGACASIWSHFCAPCASDADCGPIAGAACVAIGGDLRCAPPCEVGCPAGTRCGDEGLCVPESESCECDEGTFHSLACTLTDPDGERCPGEARCEGGVLGPCVPPSERCNGLDDDCNGIVDDPFVDARGAYFTDQHCGQCGIDCSADMTPEGPLVCGGDPFNPRCVLDCPDTHDGIQPGDRVDADGRIENGCECVVLSLSDEPGPLLASGGELDENCDGADGVVERSYYVAPDGDDSGPGSPTRPLRTLGEGIARASTSLDGDAPRRDVFVAGGEYVGTLELADGVRVFGGYRRDFRALDPAAFRVEVRADADTTAPGGAALIARGAGFLETTVAWLSLRGRDARESSEPALGAYLAETGPALTLDRLVVQAGRAGAGDPGAPGARGEGAARPGSPGAPPRAALEDALHQCIPGPENLVSGGAGAAHLCEGSLATSGGPGGGAGCPRFGFSQFSGEAGLGDAGGTGGRGGEDTRGPVFGGGCGSASGICCGLADYYVPSPFLGPAPGLNGGSGQGGAAGIGCANPRGAFRADGSWAPASAEPGSDGRAGSGGGGGGGGGSVEIEYVSGECPYPDGLGGGGGGGGAGGCGGRGGLPGGSGGVSAGLVIHRPAALPLLAHSRIVAADGGDGGDGGAGGDGGEGSEGGPGGSVPREERTTLTLSAPSPGAPGGRGGSGGKGGGGGGGCGGSSIALWVIGAGPVDEDALDAFRSQNQLEPGRDGRAGRGGEGASNAGAEGESLDARWDDEG